MKSFKYNQVLFYLKLIFSYKTNSEFINQKPNNYKLNMILHKKNLSGHKPNHAKL